MGDALTELIIPRAARRLRGGAIDRVDVLRRPAREPVAWLFAASLTRSRRRSGDVGSAAFRQQSS
jgi:hypothetical protein